MTSDFSPLRRTLERFSTLTSAGHCFRKARVRNRARRRRHAPVADQRCRADFREGSVDSIPFGSASFTKACTVNSVYFWRSLEAGFAEIHRVLAPGGRIVVGFLPKEWMDRLGHPSDIFTGRTSVDIIVALSAVGFRDPHIERPDAATQWQVVAAGR